MVEIPMRLDTTGAARYLREKHGIPIEEKTVEGPQAPRAARTRRLFPD